MCIFVDHNRRFEETCRFRIKARRIGGGRRERNSMTQGMYRRMGLQADQWHQDVTYAEGGSKEKYVNVREEESAVWIMDRIRKNG